MSAFSGSADSEVLYICDVDEAQVYIVNLAKELAAKGDIVIADPKSDDELVY